MFQNAYQGGTHVEIYDAKVNKEKEKSYAQLYRMTTPQGFSKIFDKDIKGYIYTIDGHSTKMRFPKDDRVDLCIVQNFLVFQIYLPFGSPWSLEIGIADTQKVNRRINLVSALNKIETKYFHVKAPNDIIKRGVWMNLSIDVNSFMEAWKGQTFRSIDSITVGSACKLRRIYSMKAPIFEMNSDDDIEEQMYLQQSTYINQKPEEPPRNFSFPPGFPYTNQLITYQKILDNVDPKYFDSSVGHGDSIDSVKFGNASNALSTKGTAAAATAGGNKQQSGATATASSKTTIKQSKQQPNFPQHPNMTEDFQEKSMMGFKARENVQQQQQQHTNQRNTIDRSPIPKNPKHQTSVQRDSSVSNSRNFEEEKQADSTYNNPFRNTNNSKARNSSKTLEKGQSNGGAATLGGPTRGIPKSPNSTFTRSPNQQLQKETLERNGKGSTTTGSLRIAGTATSNSSNNNNNNNQQKQTTQAQSSKNSNNPWQAGSSVSKSSSTTMASRRKLFPDDYSDPSSTNNGRQVEEIDENLEGEYYDNYDDLPSSSAKPAVNKKGGNTSQSNHQVLQSINGSNQQQAGSTTTVKKNKPTTTTASTLQVEQQQKRAIKSANNFGAAKSQQIPSSNAAAGSSASSKNMPDKIKKKPAENMNNRKGVAGAAGESDPFTQSMNTTDMNEESYYQLTQKFNTVSDPNQFRDLFAPSSTITTNVQESKNNGKGNQQTKQQQQQKREKSPEFDASDSREIEEDIEVDQYNTTSPSANRGRKSGVASNENNNKRKQQQQQQMKQQKQQSPEPVHVFEDSLERPYPQKQEQSSKTSKNNGAKRSNNNQRRNSDEDSDEDGGYNVLGIRDNYHSDSLSAQSKGVAPNYNIYENHLNKFITQSNRPFTPPFSSVVPLTGNSIITKKNNSTVVIQTQSRGPAGTTDFNNNNDDDDDGDREEVSKDHVSRNQKVTKDQKKSSRHVVHDMDDGDYYQDDDDATTGNAAGYNSSSVAAQDQLEVIYDPVLNCYYDPASKQYYELKS